MFTTDTGTACYRHEAVHYSLPFFISCIFLFLAVRPHSLLHIIIGSGTDPTGWNFWENVIN